VVATVFALLAVVARQSRLDCDEVADFHSGDAAAQPDHASHRLVTGNDRLRSSLVRAVGTTLLDEVGVRPAYAYGERFEFDPPGGGNCRQLIGAARENAGTSDLPAVDGFVGGNHASGSSRSIASFLHSIILSLYEP
jgi:hypothetical protein